MILMLFAAVIGGCGQRLYDPSKATHHYPRDLHTTETVNMQAFRDGPKLQIVNASTESYQDFDLWINQRYVTRVDSLPAGESLTIPLKEFRDWRGETLIAGGFFSSYERTPVRLVQIQTAEDQPLLGLITVRSEEIIID